MHLAVAALQRSHQWGTRAAGTESVESTALITSDPFHFVIADSYSERYIVYYEMIPFNGLSGPVTRGTLDSATKGSEYRRKKKRSKGLRLERKGIIDKAYPLRVLATDNS